MKLVLNSSDELSLLRSMSLLPVLSLSNPTSCVSIGLFSIVYFPIGSKYRPSQNPFGSGPHDNSIHQQAKTLQLDKPWLLLLHSLPLSVVLVNIFDSVLWISYLLTLSLHDYGERRLR